MEGQCIDTRRDCDDRHYLTTAHGIQVLSVKRKTLDRLFKEFDVDGSNDQTLGGEEWLLFLKTVLSMEWTFLRK